MSTKNLLIIAIATLFTATGFAQRPAKLQTPPGKISYKTSERTDTTTPKKSPVTSKEEIYNYPFKGGNARIISDKYYVKKGDSFRIKYMFNPSDTDVTGIALDGKNVKRKDIDFKKGVWEVTLTPEKSHIYYVRVLRGTYAPMTFPQPIVVLDPDEYKEVDAKVKELIKNQDYKYYDYIRELLDKHCGKVDLLQTMRKKF